MDVVVPVVVNPIITKNLRIHQREGISFLYNCIMGKKDPNHFGCILADEMGLGYNSKQLIYYYS